MLSPFNLAGLRFLIGIMVNKCIVSQKTNIVLAQGLVSWHPTTYFMLF